MSCFLDILRCVLCCEEDGYEDRDHSRYEVLSQRTSSPARVFEQRSSPSTPSIQPRYAYGSDYWNQAPIASVREEPARKSQPKQPQINPNPMRFVTHTTPPSVSQKNSVASVHPSTISIHSTKPSTPSTSVSEKIPINSKGLDSVSHRSSVASICPPSISILSTKPSALSSSESAVKPMSSNVLGLPKKPSAQKPSALSGSDPPKKPHASSGSDPPKKPNASPSPDPPKKPSGSNVLPVYHIPEDIKHVIEKDQIPEVLKKKPVSSSNYADYFAALLYAEDYYMEKNSVDLVHPSTISIHSTKPSTLSTSVSARIPINSKGLDSVSHRSSVASSALSSSEPAEEPISFNVLGLPKMPYAQKPSALSGSDPPKKPHASSGSNPPKKPNASPGSDPPKKPSGSNVLPVYHIPGDIKHVIEKGQVPEVLKNKHISSSNYADYFAALLYAEDYYEEKWKEDLKEYVLSGRNLRLREETISGKSRQSNKKVYMNQMGIRESNKEEKKVYVEFDMDSIPGRTPFLLAKDYVYVQRSGKTVKPFQGFLLRVEKSKLCLADFGKDFHAQHSLMNKYDVWFDFNRVCLKRSHQGVAAAVDPSFRGILFPERVSRSRGQNRDFDQVEMSAVNQILSLKGPPPYLIVDSSLPSSHGIIVEAILQIYRTFKENRILIVAPQNRTCDSLIICLQEEIPVSEMFRANAAFREHDEVPEDVLSSSLYEGECFTCPPSKDLRKFKVIASTFMSSFRLHGQGLYAGHFSHIFVVDACYATEPETMVTLANLANESTAVVLTGSSEHYVRWVRSDIARAYGLRRSYFKRLLESEPYKSRDPGFVKYL